jgi:hypothetical protein
MLRMAMGKHCSRTKASIGVNERTGTVALQVVVRHAAPCFRASLVVTIPRAMSSMAVDDMEDHIRGIGTVREVAHFIDDEDSRMRLGVRD